MSKVIAHFKLTPKLAFEGHGHATISQVMIDSVSCEYIVSVSTTSTEPRKNKIITISVHSIQTFDSFKKAETELLYQLQDLSKGWASTDETPLG